MYIVPPCKLRSTTYEKRDLLISMRKAPSKERAELITFLSQFTSAPKGLST